jgi:signal transduction histidine kinase
MAVAAVMMAILLSYAVARTITRPLGTITAAMREMAATGDLTRRVRLPARAALMDEDAQLLASTFNTMTESIARVQQEAAQRERLSSLGRLSTVVAHEIRNPLMIIKAALRTLRRTDAPPERVQASVADISEEVDRLNRLVNEVLDYARPIRFDLEPIELGRVVEGSWAAVATASPAAACRLHLDPEANHMISDGERLRLALVNLLSNAAQAVRQNGAGETGGHPGIEVTTRAHPDDRIEIEVRDRGPGIAPDDLPRIFDPFFTTKPTGSGIGLAITRNIVEGLGGRLRVASQPGSGTTITVELPRYAPAPSAAAAPTTRA